MSPFSYQKGILNFLDLHNICWLNGMSFCVAVIVFFFVGEMQEGRGEGTGVLSPSFQCLSPPPLKDLGLQYSHVVRTLENNRSSFYKIRSHLPIWGKSDPKVFTKQWWLVKICRQGCKDYWGHYFTVINSPHDI